MSTTAQPWIYATTALALALIGTACVPLFENPLPADAELKPDPALIGTWSGLQTGDGSQLALFPRQDGWLDIVYATDINAQSEHGAHVTQYEGYTTTVDDERFLCFREYVPGPTPAGATPLYMLARYRIDPPTRLSMQVFEQESIRALIQRDRLQGSIGTNSSSGTITVTSSPAHLVAAIVSEGVNAFVSTNLDLRFGRMGVLPAPPTP